MIKKFILFISNYTLNKKNSWKLYAFSFLAIVLGFLSKIILYLTWNYCKTFSVFYLNFTFYKSYSDFLKIYNSFYSCFDSNYDFYIISGGVFIVLLITTRVLIPLLLYDFKSDVGPLDYKMLNNLKKMNHDSKLIMHYISILFFFFFFF